MFFQSSIGINISDTRVSIVLLKGSVKGPVLQESGSLDFKPQQSVQEKIKTAGLFAKNFIQQNSVLSPNIFISIPGGLTMLKELEFPWAVKENLADTLNFEMEKYIPVPINKVYYDYQIIEEDKNSNHLKVIIAVAQKKAIDPYFKLKDVIGAGITGVEICSLAVINYCFHAKVMNSDISAVFFWNQGDFEFCLVKKGFPVYVRSGSEVDNSDSMLDILKALKVLKATAENREVKPKVLICGAQLDNPEVQKLQADPDIQVKMLDLKSALLPLSELAPAYGLALKGLCKVRMRINLYPAQLRKKPSKTSYYIMLSLAVMVLLSCFAWGGSILLHRNLILNRLDRQIKPLAAQVKDVDKIQSNCAIIEKKIRYLNRIRQEHVPRLDILKELSLIIPESSWIQRFNFTAKGLNLSGYSQDASELIPILESSDLFYDAAFTAPITKGKEGQEKFIISLKVKGEN